MRLALALFLQALVPALALEHDYFASYYGNEGTASSSGNSGTSGGDNKWEEPDAMRRQDMWPPAGSKGGSPSDHPQVGKDGTITKYGNEEIYWGPHPPPQSEAYYGYPSHYPHMPSTPPPPPPPPPPPKDTGVRLSKKPYSYYFLGRKLWYIPLYFAIYYTLYVGALIIKAIARHRINLPPGYGRNFGGGLSDLVGHAISEFGRKYL